MLSRGSQRLLCDSSTCVIESSEEAVLETDKPMIASEADMAVLVLVLLPLAALTVLADSQSREEESASPVTIALLRGSEEAC